MGKKPKGRQVPFMSMNTDLMIACRYAQLKAEIKKLKSQIKLNKCLLWRNSFLGRIKIICENHRLRKTIDTLQKELNEFTKEREK